MNIDYSYDRRTSPFLALTEGVFQFLHTSVDRIHDISVRGLHSYPMGEIAVPSGKLIVGDPFADLKRTGNQYVHIPPGTYTVWQTVADVSENQDGKPLRVAYFSLVIEPALLFRRWRWQQERDGANLSPEIPIHALKHVPLENDIQGAKIEENVSIENTGVMVQSGTVCMVDREAFANHMPEDHPDPSRGWYDTLFEHGIEGSWFDRMDYVNQYRRGAANFELPNSDITIALSQAGWGDGTYFLVAEYAFDYDEGEPLEPEWIENPPLTALHLDFRVIPFDPSQPIIPIDEEI